jgi:hypothetical protein
MVGVSVALHLRRRGFQAALARCRKLGAVPVAARLDRITRRAHTPSQLLE